MRKIVICMMTVLLLQRAQAQTDTTNIFERLTTELKSYTPDTTDVPNDKLTQKIREFRALRGGFNINEAMRFKMEEEKSKDPNNTQNAILQKEFESGNARRWLDNATIWIYRKQFSYREMKKIVKFYRTSAGQKLATDSPLTMIKTMAAADMIMKAVSKK